MSVFGEIRMDEEQIKRFEMLVERTGPPAWWIHVLSSGAFIAGGASLFVADTAQCIGTVGDIDVWAPVEPVVLLEWITALCSHYDSLDLAWFVNPRGATVTVYTSRMNVQFIRIDQQQDLHAIISRFDLTYLQCALRGRFSSAAAAPAVGGLEIELISTKEAVASWKTRRTTWSKHGTRCWIGREMGDGICAAFFERLEKMARKGFWIGYKPEYYRLPAPHQCDHEHRGADWEPQLGGGVLHSAAILSLATFTEENYRINPAAESTNPPGPNGLGRFDLAPV